MIEQSIIKKLLPGLGIAAFLSLYSTKVSGENNRILESLFLFSYGQLNIEHIKYVAPILLWILPQAFLMYILGDYISVNFNRNACYIFTRTSNRKKWFLLKLLSLFCYVIIFYLMQFITVLGVAGIFGFKIHNYTTGLPLILAEYLLIVLVNYWLILFANIFSLTMNAVYSYCLTIAVNLFSILTSGVIYELHKERLSLIMLLPSAQGILAWHDITYLFMSYPQLFNIQISGFSLGYSILYLVMFSIVLIIWGLFRIENMEIM